MEELFIVILPILLTDVVNPVLFAAVVFTLGSSRPNINTFALLLSYFVCYFLSGCVIAVGIESFFVEWHIPDSLDYVLEFLVASLLFYVAYSQLKQEEKPDEYLKEADQELSTLKSVKLGFDVNLIGLPFAIPYLAWIDQILKADISYTAAVFFLLFYNILYILPFFGLIGVRWVYKEQSDEILRSLNQTMVRIANRYLPILFIILGLLLLEDCLSYFIGYREYSFISLFK